MLTACLGQSNSETAIYAHNFSNGSGGWNTAQTLLLPEDVPADVHECWTSWLGKLACTMDVPVADDLMMLQSPWWLDPNHAPPGAGYLSLLTWIYLDAGPGTSTEHLKEIDLRGATLRLAIRIHNLDLKGGQLVFWFQTAMPDGRSVNYVYTGMPLSSRLIHPDELNLIEVELSSDAAVWTCLGSAEDRTDTYGCIPLAEAISRVDYDFGLIIFPVDASPLPEAQPSGTIYVQSIELVRK